MNEMSEKKFRIFSVLADASRGQYALPHAAMEIKAIADTFIPEDGNLIDWGAIGENDLHILEAAQDDMDMAKELAAEHYDDPAQALSEIIGDVLNVEVTLDGVAFHVETTDSGDALLMSEEMLDLQEAQAFVAEHEGFMLGEE